MCWIKSKAHPQPKMQNVNDTYAEVLRYTTADHADFHRQIQQEPEEQTNALAYADWLEEQGKGNTASVIRSHANDYRTGAVRLSYWPEEVADTEPNAFYAEPNDFEGKNYLHLHTVSSVPSNEADPLDGKPYVYRLSWFQKFHSPQERAEAAKKLQGEGVNVHPNLLDADGWDDPPEKHRASDEVVRYSAVPDHEVHPDYQPTGVAPRIGNLLKQLSAENSDAGLLAEGIARTGDHSLLKILADKLDDDGHPLKDAIDWRHAERGMNIDRVLDSAVYGSKRIRSAEGGLVRASPGWILADWRDGGRSRLSRRKALQTVRQEVPDATPTDLAHSLLRLTHHYNIHIPADASIRRLMEEDGSHNREFVESLFPNHTPWKSPVPEHIVANNNAILTQLGHSPADVFKYPDTRPANKRVYRLAELVAKYTSYKAPAKGIIVKESPLAVVGTFSDGGSFINDLTKLNTQPAEQPKPRLTLQELRRRWKAMKSKA